MVIDRVDDFNRFAAEVEMVELKRSVEPLDIILG